MIIIFYFLIVPINFLGVSERFVNYSTKPSSDLLIIPEVINLIEDLYEQKLKPKTLFYGIHPMECREIM